MDLPQTEPNDSDDEFDADERPDELEIELSNQQSTLSIDDEQLVDATRSLNVGWLSNQLGF